MEFGKVTPDEFKSIDFSLPPDAPGTTEILKKSPTGSTIVYVGCAKWGRKDWVGKIYPKGTKEADFLNHYAKFFNGIELNATFYKMPSAGQAGEWSRKVTAGFKFCPKVSDKISHIKRLKDTGELTERFLSGISGFGENLGPVLLMVHPQMGPKSLEVLTNFVQSFPKEIPLCVELRHKEWFSNPEAFRQVFDMFQQSSVGSVITDAAGRRDCVHMRLTTPYAFIRFQGYGLHPTDYTRVDAWVQRIKTWIAQGIHSVYFFMHQEDEVNSPVLARYVIQRLNAECGLQIPEPKFHDD